MKYTRAAVSADFDRIQRELGEIRRRARSIEAGAVEKDELTRSAREIVESSDRLVRLVEDAQREWRRAKRAADEGSS